MFDSFDPPWSDPRDRGGQDELDREIYRDSRERGDDRAPVGHHAFDAGAVLGGVQGSPLRFDRAVARPSGLDAASAQLLSWQ